MSTDDIASQEFSLLFSNATIEQESPEAPPPFPPPSAPPGEEESAEASGGQIPLLFSYVRLPRLSSIMLFGFSLANNNVIVCIVSHHMMLVLPVSAVICMFTQAAILLLSIALLLKGLSELCRRLRMTNLFSTIRQRATGARPAPSNDGTAHDFQRGQNGAASRANAATIDERPKSLHGVWVQLPDGSVTLGTLPGDESVSVDPPSVAEADRLENA